MQIGYQPVPLFIRAHAECASHHRPASAFPDLGGTHQTPQSCFDVALYQSWITGMQTRIAILQVFRELGSKSAEGSTYFRETSGCESCTSAATYMSAAAAGTPPQS